MKRIMVIQHESYEALGTWGPILKGIGGRIRFINFERTPDEKPSLDRYDALILLGGYMGVYEAENYGHLKVELALVEDALKRGIPLLGICLGSQILASVLGASVRRHTQREMGWGAVQLTRAGLKDPLVGHFEPTEKVFQSHGDTFDVPNGAQHLARSEVCEGQAFRYGQNAYGLQFHLEVNRAIIEDWMEMPENQGLFDAGQVVEDTDLHLSRSLALSEETFRRFLQVGGARSRPMRLGSGHKD
jgi:GMP synthase (glutamine-hydrolysing)